MLHPRFAAAVAALIVAAAVTPAWALPPIPHVSARLSYTHAANVEGCLSETQFRDVLASYVGYDVIHPLGDARLSLHVTLHGPKLDARLTVDDKAGEPWHSHFERSTDCAAVGLDAAMTFRVLLAIRTPVPGAPDVAPRRATKAAPARQAAPARASFPTYRVSAGPSVALGITPGVSVGGGAEFALQWQRVSVGVGVRALESISGLTSDDGTRFRSLAVLATGDAGWRHGVFYLGGVASVGVLQVAATPRGDVQPGALYRVVAGLGVRAGVLVPLAKRLSLSVTADGGPQLTHTTVRLGGGDLWTTPRAFGVLEVALGLSL